MDTIQHTLTLNGRRVDEDIVASTRASLQAVDALSLRFETLFNSNNVTQQRPPVAITAPTPAPVTSHDLQVPPPISY